MAQRKKRADGRVCVQFRYNGKVYSAYGATSKEAEHNADLMRLQLEAGIYVSPSERRRREKAAAMQEPRRMPTFEEFSDEWLEEKRVRRLKETTIRSTSLMVELICRTKVNGHRFGDFPLDEITRRDVRQLQCELSTKVATRTTNDAISTVRSIYRYAIADRVVIWNPADNVVAIQRTEERAGDSYHRALTEEETTAFFNAAKESRYYNLYVLLLHTGLRIGEAGALYAADIDAKGITVSRSVTRTETGGYKIGNDTKTEAGRRWVPLDDAAREALRDQMAINRALNPKIVKMQAPIFTAAKGGIIHSSIINQDMTKVCKKAGIEKATAHAFRATFVTRSLEQGLTMTEVGNVVGHKYATMTAEYNHTDRNKLYDKILTVNYM